MNVVSPAIGRSMLVMVVKVLETNRLITLPLFAGLAGLLLLVPWLIDGMLLLEGLMAFSLLAIELAGAALCGSREAKVGSSFKRQAQVRFARMGERQ